MLGNRGCRLKLLYPEIYLMQVEAILNAAVQLLEEGVEVKAEIMIPLVSHSNELERMRRWSVRPGTALPGRPAARWTSSSGP